MLEISVNVFDKFSKSYLTSAVLFSLVIFSMSGKSFSSLSESCLSSVISFSCGII